MNVVTLSCHHVVKFKTHPPLKGAEHWCLRCEAYQRVITSKANYAVRCRDCTLSTLDIARLETARSKASRHVMKRYTHRVDILDTGIVVETIAQDEGQGELPFDAAVRDRIALVTEHQRVLREALLPKRDPETDKKQAS